MTKALLLKLLYIDPCIYRLRRVHFRIRNPNSEIIIFDSCCIDGNRVGKVSQFRSVLVPVSSASFSLTDSLPMIRH